MKVQDLMTKKVRVCHLEEVLSNAAQAMWEGDCGAIPVLDQNGIAVGMLTDRDICMATYTQGLPPQAISVRSAMSRELLSCAPDDTLPHAEELMREHQIRRLSVINDKGELVGILSLNDLAREYGREKNAKRREIRGSEVAATLAAICAARPQITHAAA